MTDGNWHHGDHIVMYKDIKSLFCILKTNIILHANYNSIKINK